MTTQQAIENAKRETSIGHIAEVDGWEYFTAPNGDVVRAPLHCPMTVFGYRNGARFVSTPVNWERYAAAYNIPTQKGA